ncbi:aldose 1-epimerase [Craterilacuibacter sp.]|uniref:aldose 1-epimerase n=1 Tax=Craterilacuibacter sp. TaxID=2870909 RepID=UPI003F2DC760
MGIKLTTLRQAGIEADLAPALGGGLAGMRIDGVPVLRPWNGDETVRRMASYPLVPYSNRIARGRFDFGGKAQALRLNFGDHPHPLHGLGWQREWTLEQTSDASAVMRLAHRPEQNEAEDWPWAFDATQTFSLTGSSLTVTLAYHNLADTIVPVGLGWHPFFPRTLNGQDATLEFSADGVWMMDEQALPASLDAIPAKWNYQQARPLGQPGLDNCFAMWHGEARIAWPGSGMAIRMSASEELGHLVVFTPASPADFFAVEPVSHANNAINMSKPAIHGIKEIAAGATLEVTMRLTIERNAA